MLLYFDDISTVASWAMDGVSFCSNNGIMNGTVNKKNLLQKINLQ